MVTGGCGFVGHHLCRALLAGGHPVTVLDDLSTGRRQNLPQHEGLRLVEGSVLDRDAVKKAAKGVQLVFHLANVVGMKLVREIPDQTRRVSVEGTQNIIDLTGEAPLVIFSSSAVYGKAASEPVQEDSAALGDPQRFAGTGLSHYAEGKWRMELLGQEAARSGRSVIIVRPFNLVGPGQKSDYGMVLPTFLKMADRAEALPVYDDGKQKRCFGDVETAAASVVKLAALGPRLPGQNVFNLGNPVETSILELAEMVIRCVGKGSIRFIPYSSVFEGTADVRRRIPDTSRLDSLIGPPGWTPLPALVQRIYRAEQDGLGLPRGRG